MATQQIREKITESDAHNQSPLSAYPAAYTKAKTIFAVSAEVRAPLAQSRQLWLMNIFCDMGFGILSVASVFHNK